MYEIIIVVWDNPHITCPDVTRSLVLQALDHFPRGSVRRTVESARAGSTGRLMGVSDCSSIVRAIVPDVLNHSTAARVFVHMLAYSNTTQYFSNTDPEYHANIPRYDESALNEVLVGHCMNE